MIQEPRSLRWDGLYLDLFLQITHFKGTSNKPLIQSQFDIKISKSAAVLKRKLPPLPFAVITHRLTNLLSHREQPYSTAGWVPSFRKALFKKRFLKNPPKKGDFGKLSGSTQWLELNHTLPQFFVSRWRIKWRHRNWKLAAWREVRARSRTDQLLMLATQSNSPNDNISRHLWPQTPAFPLSAQRRSLCPAAGK